jgi:uncharacterized protein
LLIIHRYVKKATLSFGEEEYREGLEEILHRYVSIGRRDAIQPALDALLGVVYDVFAVERMDVKGAKKVLDGLPSLSARDALHVAVMRRRNVLRIMSFDTGFDQVPGLSRIPR